MAVIISVFLIALYCVVGVAIGLLLGYVDKYPVLSALFWPLLGIVRLVEDIKNFINNEIKRDGGKKL